jgi:plasmid stability protein
MKAEGGRRDIILPSFASAPVGACALAVLVDIMISSGQEVSSMAQFIVRKLEEDVKIRLKRRAQRNGRSMEEEVRHILRNAAKEESRPVQKLGTRIAALFENIGLTQDLPELKGEAVRPMRFDE